MEQKIQLRHPSGKKAISMDAGKYNLLRKALLNCLNTKGESTHSEIFQAVTEDFKMNLIQFEGSVEWHLEWVKLDLEARNEIKRIADKPPVRFAVVRTDN